MTKWMDCRQNGDFKFFFLKLDLTYSFFFHLFILCVFGGCVHAVPHMRKLEDNVSELVLSKLSVLVASDFPH